MRVSTSHFPFPFLSRSSRVGAPRSGFASRLLLPLVALGVGFPTLAADTPFLIGPNQLTVNVMKTAMPKLPTFPKLAPQKGFVRGYVKDSSGKPLQGAKIGVRSSSAGGFYSGASGVSDARGYYEVKVPWGAASYYCAGYTINYGEGRAAMGLHPADGEANEFASANGSVENWVLLAYGIADRDAASEKPYYAANYYGGAISVDFQVADPRPIFADDYSLPEGSEIELTLTPTGKLADGSQGRSFTFRKAVTEHGNYRFGVTNIPIGVYRASARLLQGGQSAPLRLEETGPSASSSFGLEPKAARGTATLTFRPGGAKPESALAQHGNWDSILITLKK